MNATYVKKTHQQYLYYQNLLRDENPIMCKLIDRISIEKWAQHADEGCRYGHMMTNLSECINTVLKGIQNLPIMALVKSTYFHLVELFVRKGREAEAQLATRQKFLQAQQWAIEENRQLIGTMTVFGFSRSNSSFVIEELRPVGAWSQRNYRLRLTDRWCDCGYFQALHYPCRHLLVACAYARLDWTSLVDGVYHIQMYLTSIEWSLYLLQMKITSLHIVDLEYVQIWSLGKLLRVVQFRPESGTKWMRLIPSNQSVVAGVSKRVIPDEDVQPYMLHPPSRLVKIISFVCL